MNPQPLPTNIVPLPTPHRFAPPTIEQCLAHGSTIELPEHEVNKFWHHYESQGWKVGKSPMKVWKSAMAGWKLRWEEKAKSHLEPNETAKMILRQKELDRVEEKMKSIKGSYSENLSWDAKDRNLYGVLKKRRDELVKLLGMAI